MEEVVAGSCYFCFWALICAPCLCPQEEQPIIASKSPLSSLQEPTLEEKVKRTLDRLVNSKFEASKGAQ